MGLQGGGIPPGGAPPSLLIRNASQARDFGPVRSRSAFFCLLLALLFCDREGFFCFGSHTCAVTWGNSLYT